MKLKHDTELKYSFQPREVTIVIETEEEYDALILARGMLLAVEINDKYDFKTRQVWVNILETIGEGL
jgi:hypothetical protein